MHRSGLYEFRGFGKVHFCTAWVAGLLCLPALAQRPAGPRCPGACAPGVDHGTACAAVRPASRAPSPKRRPAPPLPFPHDHH